MASLRDYYLLIKPGIVYGNAYHVAAGVFLAYQFDWSWLTALGVLAGTSLMIASACIVNNYFDRHEDAKMPRTRNRVLATGEISGLQATVLAMFGLLAGLGVLLFTTNLLTVAIGVTAYMLYAFVYTFLKRITAYNTLVGTIPGALPGVAGYTAFSGSIDLVAWLIFLVLALWQLPHFYAIAIRRRDEYSETEFRFITAALSKRSLWLLLIGLIVGYGVAFVWLAILMMHWIFVALICLSVAWWLWIAMRKPTDFTAWAKKVFLGSLVLMLVFSATTLGNFMIEKIFG